MLGSFDSSRYSANVLIGTVGLVTDRYYGYGRTTQAVAGRISETEEVHINAVHPIDIGQYQMADAYFSQILKLIQ